MPRLYKRTVGLRQNANYDPKYMERAIKAVKNNAMSIRSAALQFAVPYTTLHDRITGLHTKRYGGQTVLTKKEEELLVNGLLTTAEWGFPLTRRDVLKLVQNYLNSKVSYEDCFLVLISFLCHFQ